MIQGDSGNVRTATAIDQAWFVMNGIDVASLSLFDTSRLDVISGYVGAAQLMGRNDVLIAGGTVSSIVIDGTTLTASQVEMTGGTVDAMEILGKVQATITGGLIGSLSIVAESVATILGGTIEPNTIRLFDRGVLNLHGRDLMLSLAGFGADSQGDFTRYRLSGTLSTGDVLAGINVLSYDGALGIGDPTLGAANTGSVRFFSAAVPEPTTVSLLCLALIGMVTANARAARRGSAPRDTLPFNSRSPDLG